jgi:hypothetical protein
MASAFFYHERVSQHLRIGIETMRLLREQEGGKPSFQQAARLQRSRLPVGAKPHKRGASGFALTSAALRISSCIHWFDL